MNAHAGSSTTGERPGKRRKWDWRAARFIKLPWDCIYKILTEYVVVEIHIGALDKDSCLRLYGRELAGRRVFIRLFDHLYIGDYRRFYRKYPSFSSSPLGGYDPVVMSKASDAILNLNTLKSFGVSAPLMNRLSRTFEARRFHEYMKPLDERKRKHGYEIFFVSVLLNSRAMYWYRRNSYSVRDVEFFPSKRVVIKRERDFVKESGCWEIKTKETCSMEYDEESVRVKTVTIYRRSRCAPEESKGWKYVYEVETRLRRSTTKSLDLALLSLTVDTFETPPPGF